MKNSQKMKHFRVKRTMKKIMSLILCVHILGSALIQASAQTDTESKLNDTRNTAYIPKLMSEELDGNSQFSIETFEVGLFDYSPKVFNASVSSLYSSDADKHFMFVGYDTGNASNGGVNDAVADYAKQGIVQSSLDDGLPVFNYVDHGKENAQWFFDPSKAITGKTYYPNVDFEFIYDKTTGWYEYKSSANHAQFDPSANRIRLYADTLSTQNAKTHFMDLTTAVQGPYMTITNTTASTMKAETGYSGTRIDPYFNIAVNNIPGNSIHEIFFQVKVPKELGTVQSKVYYLTQTVTSANEQHAFKINFTATGEWQTIRLTPTGDDWTNGIITELRVDPYDNFDSAANNGAGGSVGSAPVGNYTMELRNLVLYGGTSYSSTVSHTTNGGFYPFSDIAVSYESYQQFSYDKWLSHMEDTSSLQTFSSRSIGYPVAENLTDHLSYGFIMEFDFYIPMNASDEDLTFFFAGDDDLWVFADDQLVLDIGGGHGAIRGTVNFSRGESVVQNTVQVTGFNSNDGIAKESTTYLPAEVMSPGKHTLKIFYMERCGSVSNCQIKFNLPQTPDGSVFVSKEVSVSNSDDLSALSQEVFEYNIVAENAGHTIEGDVSRTEFPPYTYSHIDAEGTATTMETDAEGRFFLKHGEAAIFEFDENHEITVTEIVKDLVSYIYVMTTVNGESIDVVDGKIVADTMITQEGETCDFIFVNNYEKAIEYGSLSITKKVDKEYAGDILPDDSFSFTITGADVNLTISLKAGETKVIPDLPLGEYEITENFSADSPYSCDWENNTITVIVTDGTVANVICTNTYLQQSFIEGTGIAILKSITFTGSLEGWKFEIRNSDGEEIPGSPATTDSTGMLIIDNLLPGEYTVTEILPADSPYQVDTPITQTATVTNGSMTILEFVNSLKFGSVTIRKTTPSGNPLPGVTILLECSSDGVTWSPVFYADFPASGGCASSLLENGTLTSDEMGIVEFTRLDSSLYYRATEIACPSDYILTTESIFEGKLPAEQDFAVSLTL